jgi:hypothetical protein
MNQVLFGSKIPLSSLNRRVAQQQLNLLQFTAGRPAELGARAARIVGRDARYGEHTDIDECPFRRAD